MQTVVAVAAFSQRYYALAHANARRVSVTVCNVDGGGTVSANCAIFTRRK